MGEFVAFGTGGLLHCSFRAGASLRWAACGVRGALGILAASVLIAGCTPAYDWRDIRGPGGEYWVQLPAKPATLTRQIHLEGFEVEMTMQGAKVGENAFTVALVPLPKQPVEAAGMSPERVQLAMREQMLRNIGAPVSTRTEAAAVDLVSVDGKKIGKLQTQAIATQGTGKHAAIELRARFVVWQDHALQIVAIGPELDPEQAGYFLDSLRLVKR